MPRRTTIDYVVMLTAPRARRAAPRQRCLRVAVRLACYFICIGELLSRPTNSRPNFGKLPHACFAAKFRFTDGSRLQFSALLAQFYITRLTPKNSTLDLNAIISAPLSYHDCHDERQRRRPALPIASLDGPDSTDAASAKIRD